MEWGKRSTARENSSEQGLAATNIQQAVKNKKVAIFAK